MTRKRACPAATSGEEEDAAWAAPKQQIITIGCPTVANTVVVQLGDEQLVRLPCKHLASKSRYFAARLSERWAAQQQHQEEQEEEQEEQVVVRLSASQQQLPAYLATLRLVEGEVEFGSVVTSVEAALRILGVACELLLDETMAECLRYLEAVHWTPEEEKAVCDAIAFLQLDEAASRAGVLARVGVGASGRNMLAENMLADLVEAAGQQQGQAAAAAKAFVGRLLWGRRTEPCVRTVLEAAFIRSLRAVQAAVEEWCSHAVVVNAAVAPPWRQAEEEAARKRQALHVAASSARHLAWIVDRMVDLRMADAAAAEWSRQAGFAANLCAAFADDVARDHAPGLPALLLRCTARLAAAMAGGGVVAAAEQRRSLVQLWLPVLAASKNNAMSANCNRQLHQELQDLFLHLILTLPLPHSHKLLQSCLTFASRIPDDPSTTALAAAFTTWFRRAAAANNAGGADDEE